MKLSAPPASEPLLLEVHRALGFLCIGGVREETETTGDSFLKFGLAIKISVRRESIP